MIERKKPLETSSSCELSHQRLHRARIMVRYDRKETSRQPERESPDLLHLLEGVEGKPSGSRVSGKPL